MSHNRIRLFASSALTAVAVTFFPMQNAQAAPTGGNVVGGAATIATSGTATNITQTSNRAAINWTSFNVASGESVNFTVPTNGATLNRISGSASTIAGTVTSNGTLYLVNPNGFTFAYGSTVSAKNFMASTIDMDPTKFMNGSGSVTTSSNTVTNATINLNGTITAADGGFVKIFAPQVSNYGTITANLGVVKLGGVQTTVVSFDNSGLMQFEVGTTEAGTQGTFSVTNNGTITAHGGKVILDAEGASDLLNAALESYGAIDVSSTTGNGGTVTIKTNNTSSSTWLSGNVNAAGAANFNGGTIDIARTGDNWTYFYGNWSTGNGNIKISTNGGTLYLWSSTTITAANLTIDLVNQQNGNAGTFYGSGQSSILTALGANFSFAGGMSNFANNSIELGDGRFNYNITVTPTTPDRVYTLNAASMLDLTSQASSGFNYQAFINAVHVNDSTKSGFGLNVINGSVLISGVGAPTGTVANGSLPAWGLTTITANGIAVSGINNFSGNLRLTSNGQVGAAGNGDPNKAGITFYSGSSLTVGGSLVIENRGNVSASGQSSSAYGIDIYQATISAGKDLSIIQTGNVEAHATQGMGDVYGINIDGSGSGKSTAISAGNNIVITQTGSLSSDNGNAIGIDLYGYKGGLTLNAGHDVKISTNGTVKSGTDLNQLNAPTYALGIGIYDAKVTATNDITLNQAGSLNADLGGAYGIQIYSTNSQQKSTTNYTLSAGRDISFTQDGNVVSAGYMNESIGVSITKARLVAGRNVNGYQTGNVEQNYAPPSTGLSNVKQDEAGNNITEPTPVGSKASGIQNVGSEIDAGSNSDGTPSPSKGSVSLNQSGKVGIYNPSNHDDATDSHYNAKVNQPDEYGNIFSTNPNPSTNPSPTGLDSGRVPAVQPVTASSVTGVYIGNSQYNANGNIWVNQTGTLSAEDNVVAPVGISLNTNDSSSNHTVLFKAGGSNNIVGLKSRAGQAITLSETTPNSDGTFQVKNAGTLLVDLGNNVFEAGGSTLDAGGINLVISAKEVKNGGNFTAYATSRAKTAINLQNGSGNYGSVTVLKHYGTSPVTVNGTIIVAANPLPAASLAQINFAQNVNTANVRYGIETDGILTISGVPTQNLAWLQGGTVKIMGSAAFSGATTIIASGNLSQMVAASGSGANATPAINAGIYVAPNATLSTASGNLTLVVNGSYTATASSNVNAYGLYVANGGSIGGASQTGNITIQQNGAITTSGTGKAAGVYVAGTIRGGIVTLDQTGRINAASTGASDGVVLASGGTLNSGSNDLTINSAAGADMVINGNVTAYNLTVNAGTDIDATGSNMSVSNNISATADGAITFGTVSAVGLTATANGNVTFNNNLTLSSTLKATTKGDVAFKGKIIARNGSLPNVTVNAGGNLSFADTIAAGNFTVTAGRHLKLVNSITANNIAATAANNVSFGGAVTSSGDVTVKATSNNANVNFSGTVTAATFNVTAGGDITAYSNSNAIQNITGLKGNVVRIYNYYSSQLPAGQYLHLSGNIAVNNLYLYSNSSTNYSLDGTNMTLSNQAGTAAPNYRRIDGGDATGTGYFTTPGRRGRLDANGFAYALNSSIYSY